MCVFRGPDHVLERANAAYLDFAGRHDVLGNPLAEAFPETPSRVLALLDDVHRSGEACAGTEVPFQCPSNEDGSSETRYFNILYEPLKEPDGIFYHAVDVTEQVRARELVKRTARANQMIMDRSLDVICTFDRDGRFVQVSAACERLWGFAPEELRGRALTDLVHSEDFAETDAACRSVCRGRDFSDFEHRMVRKDGGVVDMIWTCTWSETDELTFAVGRDVTDKKAREQALAAGNAALRKSEARYRTMVDTAHEGVWMLDADARTVFANARMANMLGYQAEDMHGRTFLEFVHPEDRAAGEARFDRRRKGLSESYDIRFCRRDGSEMWTLISGSPVYDDAGQFAGSLGMLTDITERKLHEQGLIDAKEKAEELARLKTTLLTNMSHEIRTPLTGILGFAEIIASSPTDHVSEYAEYIARSGERLMDTLNSVLELAQLECGSILLKPQPVDVAAVADELFAQFEKQARTKGLYLRVVHDQPHLATTADRGALSRVLSRLVNNGLKFTQEGGVTIRAGRRDGAVVVAVADTGIGIDEAFVPELFDDFKQESEGMDRNFEGVGLGLSITKRLVALMGGTIEVASKRGSGSTFTVTLPGGSEPFSPAREHMSTA